MSDMTIGADSRQAQPSSSSLWPDYSTPDDLTTIEAQPLSTRGLPETTYDVLRRAARLWPDRTAVTTMPEAARWSEGASRTYAELFADVNRTANALLSLGVRRGDAVALLAPNGAELITATLAAQVAGVAAPINAGLRAEHIVELLKRSGARVLVCAGPGIDPRVWTLASAVAERRRYQGHGSARTGRVGAARPPRCAPARLPRRSGGGTTGGRIPGRAPGSRRHRRALPHRRNHGHAQAGGAHPRERGVRRLVRRRDLDARR